MKVVSLFDGISCARVALERAGFHVSKYFSYETCSNAIFVSKNNYNDIVYRGDVFSFFYADVSKYVDLVIGGSPCTYWSISKRNRETDTNGVGFSLFKKYVEIVETLRPKYFVYENNYRIPDRIIKAITNALHVEPIMIDSALVSAQSRKRLYWTNIKNITQPDDRHILLKDILESGVALFDKSYCIDASYYKGASLEQCLNKHRRTQVLEPIKVGSVNKGQSGRVYSVEGKAVTIKASGGGQGAKTGLYKIDAPDGTYTIRKLSCVEAERCQTLPDNYTRGISNTNRYKCIGNGFTVDVIAHILSFMK